MILYRLYYILRIQNQISCFRPSSSEYLIFGMQVQNATAAHIMKGDDDTFIRVDTVLKELDKVSVKKSLYMGNLNLLHRPLRSGKWAVSYEVCNGNR